MAASSKFDISTSPDRPSYPTGQRGSYVVSSLDRSGSFRESMENPVPSSLQSMPRSSSAVIQEDIIGFFQCLHFDPKSVAADYKLYRQGELKRILSVALGISQDDSPSSSSKAKLLSSPPTEEVKKAKAILRESSDKARDRVKIFSEALLVLNKVFPSVPSRKRSRTDIMSGDRASAVPSSDRSGLVSSIGKMGTSAHAVMNSLEVEPQRAEERAKSAIISKRTRTSLLDARANSVARPSMLVDKERDVLRLASGGAVLGEDRSLSVGVDGWQKSKMKKKRSGIKPDVSPSTVSNKPIDGYREPKQGMQQRHVNDSRARLNESHGFRPGVSGAVGVGKSNGILQQSGTSLRSSIGRGDQENNSVLCDKKDRSVASDKERINLKALNKTGIHEDYSSTSPTSNTKVPASARAPRSSAGTLPKLSPTVYRQSASTDWEISQSTNRLSSGAGANNRKRMPSARSTSPPVGHWAGQRPQKNSRTARRTNFLPIVPSNDEAPVLDSISDANENENGSAVARRFPSSSPQNVKLKSDQIASAALSESEESGIAEIKSRDKKKMFDEVDDKARQNVPKGSALLLPPRKNKPIAAEDLGDAVRRQGRTGRGSTSTRSLTPTAFEKLGNVGTAKQLRTSKMGLDRAESKAGRPPTRKLSGRKAYTRHRHSTVPAAVDFHGSDDGQTELLTAAKAVFNPSHLSRFWRLMEPIFGFICEADTVFLKQQGEHISTLLQQTPVSMDAGNSGIPNGFESVEHERDVGFTPPLGIFPEKFMLEKRGHNVIPLCQTLIAALITEEDCKDYDSGRNEDMQIDNYVTDFQLDAGLESINLSYGLMGNYNAMGTSDFNGFRITTVSRSLNEMEEHIEPDLDSQIVAMQNSSPISNFGHSFNGLIPELRVMAHVASPESQYDKMSMDERILMEFQSIGIFPDRAEMRQTDNDEINQEIRNLEEAYHRQVSKKSNWIEKLLRSASQTRELQEKEYEQCALGKLVVMAYGKYMGWGHPSGGKGASGRAARQASLAFVRTTLEHCRKYEATGLSCFSEPAFKDIFHSGSSCLIEAQSVDAIMEDEAAGPYTSSLGLHQIDQSVENHNVYSPSAFLSGNHSAEQNIGKEDAWSTKVKKRELLLDDVGGNTNVTSGVSPSIGGTLLSSAKGKRSERDREGKVQGRELLSRNGSTRLGRPAAGNAKGERKSKAKPKQKTTQLSASVNSLLGKILEQPKASFSSVPKSSENASNNNNMEKDEFCLEFDDPDLQLPGMDVDLCGQSQDLGSWLNIDDDGLQDHDFMGLEIPMDDLADVNMMV
ncbi:hypothetical protein Ancab_027518 [Ancistrocladus abbreviatus]